MEYAILDLANLDNVRLGATSLLNRHPKLDVLVANAGVMSNAPPGAPLQRTVDGQELTLQVRMYGSLLALTRGAEIHTMVGCTRPARGAIGS
mgnify:FL=1